MSSLARVRFVRAESIDFGYGRTRAKVGGIGADDANGPGMLSNICEMPAAFLLSTPAGPPEWNFRLAEDREGKPPRRRFKTSGPRG